MRRETTVKNTKKIDRDIGPKEEKRTFRYKGRTFKTLESLAKFCKVKYRTLLSRFNKGMPIAEAVRQGRIGCARNEPKAVTYAGKKYNSLREVAQAFDINYSTLRARLQRGEKLKDAINAGASAHEIIVGEKKYKTITKACQALNFNPEIIYSRIKYNWSLNQAFELEPAPNLGPGIAGLIYQISNTINSKIYIGQTKASVEDRWRWHLEHAKRRETHPDGLHRAINQYGENCFSITILERCSDLRQLAEVEKRYISELNSIAPNGYNIGKGGEGLRSVGIAVVVKGVKYDSLLSAARAFDINYGTLCDRIDNGWDIEKALLTPAEKKNKQYFVGDLTFDSRRELARHFEISIDIIRQRERRGVPIEDIVCKKNRAYREESIACCSKKFKSKKDFAAWLGITSGTLSYHLKRQPDAASICKKFSKCVRACHQLSHPHRAS
jgi:group I intron endonuclease